MCTSYICLILKNKTHVLRLFDPILKNDAFAGSTTMKVAHIVFRDSSQWNFLTGNYRILSRLQLFLIPFLFFTFSGLKAESFFTFFSFRMQSRPPA